MFCSPNSDLKLHCQFVFRAASAAAAAGILGSLTCKLQYKLAIGLAWTNLPSTTENLYHSLLIAVLFYYFLLYLREPLLYSFLLFTVL